MMTRGPFYLYGLTEIQAWTKKYIYNIDNIVLGVIIMHLKTSVNE